MQDRATAIRARLSVKNAAGGGTLIRCECANRERDPKPGR
jgi:nitrate/nitrite-specific signal transduction histidine kinase